MVENKEVFCKIQYMVSKGFFNGLDSCGIEYTIVKGCPLAYYKTGNAGSRLSSDIDILISRRDIDKVVGILEDNGFQSSYMLNRRERIMLVSNSHQIPAIINAWGSAACRLM